MTQDSDAIQGICTRRCALVTRWEIDPEKAVGRFHLLWAKHVSSFEFHLQLIEVNGDGAISVQPQLQNVRCKTKESWIESPFSKAPRALGPTRYSVQRVKMFLLKE